ncbi:protein kinase domain-containing protein [Nocardiopsis kunsanensis]|uniref:protein kinase domain-containing protein n=1 Tax=Nocardiopsis kunsanensis TaxID=141693 RepID=UPI00034DEFAD
MGTSYLGAGPEGERVVVKVVHPELASDPDFHVRFVRESASAREVESPHTARVLDADPEAGTPWIATEYVDGITLERTVADFGILGTAALRILATGLARALEELHRNDLVHGDLNPQDVVLVDDGIRLVDFGGGRLATRLPDDVHDLAVDQVREGKAADVGTGTLVEPGPEPEPGALDTEASEAPEPSDDEVPVEPAPTGKRVAGQPPAPTGPPISVEPPLPTGAPVSVEPPSEEEPGEAGKAADTAYPGPTGSSPSTVADAGSNASAGTTPGTGAGSDEGPEPARGCPLGHLPYKAPEQAEGAMGDSASDMFALATVLVYAATGKNPFDAGTDEEVEFRLTGDAPATHDLPVLLRTLVAACWNRTPESRPTSAQFAAALANSEPPEQTSPSPAEGETGSGAADSSATGTTAGSGNGAPADRGSGETAYPVAQGHAVPEGQAGPRLAPNSTGTFRLPGPEDVRRYEEGAEPGSHPDPGQGGSTARVGGPAPDQKTADARAAAAAAAAVYGSEGSDTPGGGSGNGELTGTFTRRGRESTPAQAVSEPLSTVVSRWAAGRPNFGALPPCPQGVPPGPAEVSPDGSLIAVAGYGAICLWNGYDGTHLGEFAGFRGSVNVLAFNADGTLLATGHEDRCVRVWDLVNMRPLGVLTGHTGAVSCLEFSPDGNFIASGSADRHVLLWDLRIGRSVVSFPGHEDMVLSVSFSPDGSTLLSGSSDRSARMWRTDGTPVAMLADYESVAPMVSATAFNPARPVMATGDSDGVVRTWASDTGAEGPAFAGHHDLICDARFSADGSALVTAGWDGQVFVRDTAHYAPAAALRTGQARLRSVSLTRDGHMIVASGAGSPVLVWRL